MRKKTMINGKGAMIAVSTTKIPFKVNILAISLIGATVWTGYATFFPSPPKQEPSQPPAVETSSPQPAPPLTPAQAAYRSVGKAAEQVSFSRVEEAIPAEVVARVRQEERQLRRQEERKARETAPEPPLTDIAPPPPAVDVQAEEHPKKRLAVMGLEPPPQMNRQGVRPTMMDPAQPPRWNETLADPPPPDAVPDPFTPPPMVVNPERGGQ